MYYIHTELVLLSQKLFNKKGICGTIEALPLGKFDKNIINKIFYKYRKKFKKYKLYKKDVSIIIMEQMTGTLLDLILDANITLTQLIQLITIITQHLYCLFQKLFPNFLFVI